jgi:tetratricopeptide (TPR) repeat protein
VVYNGLLKKDRRTIHEQIALVIEQLFQDRLPEFYETLGFHFKQSQSVSKAVDYLMKSGEKSLKRYAVEESHQYYKEAFDLLTDKADKSREEEKLLIDILIKWAFVFYYRGDFKALTHLLSTHKDLAESLGEKARLGMFYAWLGFAVDCREQFKDAHQYLCRALKIGEEIENEQVIGYACTWLSWTCTDMGLFDEAIAYGTRAQEISRSLQWDQYLYFKSLGGLGYAYYHRGDRKKAFEAGKSILEYGQSHHNVRGLFIGHWIKGFSYARDGDFQAATECCEKALQLSVDPFYSHGARTLLGAIHALNGNFQEAEECLKEVLNFSREFGSERLGTPALMFLGAVTIAKGNMSEGLRMLEDSGRVFLENHRRGFYAQSEHLLGSVYLRIAEGSTQVNLSAMAKNIGFLVKKVPFAGQKAEAHLAEAIEAAKGIGAKGLLGEAYLDLARLHKAKKRTHKARECISEAIQLFEKCEMEVYLKQAKEALASLRE